jgi:hypothetical protein
MGQMMISRPEALAALPERYGPLFDRAAAVFAAAGRPAARRRDHRVRH